VIRLLAALPERTGLLTGACLLLVCLPDLAPAGTPALTPDWAALADQASALAGKDQAPAMGIAILDQNQIRILRTTGTTTPDTPFRWGSITKTFTALAALALAREHELPLDTPLTSLIAPGAYVNPWADTRPVRLLQLLELSGGFADLSGPEFNDNEPRPLADALARNASRRVVLWPPGLQHSYSNVPPGLTAAVIEQRSGQTFGRYLTDQVWKPLGMDSATLEPVAGLPGGYQADGRTPIPYWHMTFKAFGAMNASLADLARFAEILLNDGRWQGRQVLPAETVERLTTPFSTLGARHGLAVSYAAGAYGWVRGGHLFWGHGGDADGYLSRYGLLRDHGRGYVLIINTDNPPLMDSLRRLLEDALIAELPTHPEPSAAAVDLSAYPGSYYPASTRFDRRRWAEGELPGITVSREDDGLVFERGSRHTRLIPVGPGRFRRPGDPAVTVVFARDPDGALHMQGELGNYVKLANAFCPGFLVGCK
jgi:CubicO group peptidase (beta-lactamase class C family)